jgi:hypothetical protein
LSCKGRVRTGISHKDRAREREETDKIKDEAQTLRAYENKVGKQTSTNNHALY